MTKPDPRAHAAAARLYGPSEADPTAAKNPGAAERWPTLTVECWLAKRLGDRTLFDGVTTAAERRERVRQRIVSDGRQDDVAGRRAADGVEEDFRTLFERLYRVPL